LGALVGLLVVFAVVGFFAAHGRRVPAERLFINAPVVAAPEKGKPTRVDFGLR
jgi:hypothetical protein